ncbi:uncharacterized protein B0I36DRAFT_350301 [Microdochium trichocladiopsis]|uniref:Uncharacterized protein n=1 Tax=Microdochium trichocladiopsis TaxID=1682393 RepID=A0A9P8Y5I5_9PEZI|nr:uncharacterized protein B0I36DRAFT_350301 [Microdochium trichocladiopsis]KAH7029415.1 hypothetical protein B0I36DRAFT_350301 [Microdochium trichocladiopsis]
MSAPRRPLRAHAPPPSPLPGAATPPPPPSAATQGLKRIVWTGAFAAVTIVGAIYGAGLKTQQEFKAEKAKVIEATPEERIAQLETRRSALVTQRIPIQRKLDEVNERIRATEEKEQQRR